jgi:hypothetical protein
MKTLLLYIIPMVLLKIFGVRNRPRWQKILWSLLPIALHLFNYGFEFGFTGSDGYFSLAWLSAIWCAMLLLEVWLGDLMEETTAYSSTKTCRYCRSEVPRTASKCKFCSSEII